MSTIGALDHYEDFKWDISAYLELIGCAGLLMIGIFELDPFNPCMQRIHYTGALLGCGSFAGYIYQDGNFLFEHDGKVLAAIAFLGFILWNVSSFISRKFVKEIECKTMDEIKHDLIAAKITKFSLSMMFFEATFLLSGATCLCFWLMNYKDSN